MASFTYGTFDLPPAIIDAIADLLLTIGSIAVLLGIVIGFGVVMRIATGDKQVFGANPISNAVVDFLEGKI